jgi:hypothetical protein
MYKHAFSVRRQMINREGEKKRDDTLDAGSDSGGCSTGLRFSTNALRLLL